MKKALITLIVLVIFSLVGWQIYEKVSAPQKRIAGRRRNLAGAVEIKPVRKTAIRDVGLFTGMLYLGSQFIAAPKIAGRLEKPFVDIGDVVKNDQLIAALEGDEYVQQVGQARSGLEVAKVHLEDSCSALDNASPELKRAKVLRLKNIASES